jgi:3-phosphoshikimate 1-carboxyvinyltransferase
VSKDPETGVADIGHYRYQVHDAKNFGYMAQPFHRFGKNCIKAKNMGKKSWQAAIVIGAAPVTVTGLSIDSPQGDRRILDVLRAFGARVTETENAVTVSPSPLHGITLDVSQIPDLAPVLSAVAAAADGESLIYNAGRLRIKESDRLRAAADILSGLGAEIYEEEDSLRIVGGRTLAGGLCNGYGDHRMVMSAAVAAFEASGDVMIEGAEAVSKSYPIFFEDLEKIGITVRREKD